MADTLDCISAMLVVFFQLQRHLMIWKKEISPPSSDTTSNVLASCAMQANVYRNSFLKSTGDHAPPRSLRSDYSYYSSLESYKYHQQSLSYPLASLKGAVISDSAVSPGCKFHHLIMNFHGAAYSLTDSPCYSSTNGSLMRAEPEPKNSNGIAWKLQCVWVLASPNCLLHPYTPLLYFAVSKQFNSASNFNL